jgi:hypothetical protein
MGFDVKVAINIDEQMPPERLSVDQFLNGLLPICSSSTASSMPQAGPYVIKTVFLSISLSSASKF